MMVIHFSQNFAKTLTSVFHNFIHAEVYFAKILSVLLSVAVIKDLKKLMIYVKTSMNASSPKFVRVNPYVRVGFDRFLTKRHLK